MNPKSTYEPPLPTTFELTQIAALLGGNALGNDDSKLAQRAFQLWKNCDRHLLQYILLNHFEVKEIGIRGFAGIPKSWPCSFDYALKLVTPKERTRGDRIALFRLFLKHRIQIPTGTSKYSTKDGCSKHKAPSEKETLDRIEAAFKELKQQGFKNLKEYQTGLSPFLDWLTRHKAKKKSAQRSLAAKAMHEARRQKIKVAKDKA